MDEEITRYLNDHLAGSSGALLLIQQLADNHGKPNAREFLLDLKIKVEADRTRLESLLGQIGQSPSTLHKVAGVIASRIGSIKLMWEQIEPGKLGLVEALEMLALGVQGKRMLWAALGEIAGWFPEWSETDFAELELQAIQQRDAVELWRVEAILDTLADPGRRGGNSHIKNNAIPSTIGQDASF